MGSIPATLGITLFNFSRKKLNLHCTININTVNNNSSVNRKFKSKLFSFNKKKLKTLDVTGLKYLTTYSLSPSKHPFNWGALKFFDKSHYYNIKLHTMYYLSYLSYLLHKTDQNYIAFSNKFNNTEFTESGRPLLLLNNTLNLNLDYRHMYSPAVQKLFLKNYKQYYSRYNLYNGQFGRHKVSSILFYS